MVGTPPAPPRLTRPVALVGLPGSGKSTVARLLAAELGVPHRPLDVLIEQAAGRPIPAIFAAEGEAGFRARELAALRGALADGEPAVVDCGGGLVAQDEARRLLLETCSVVWLDAPDAELLHRLGAAEDRPLLRGDPAAGLARLRHSRATAHAVVPVRVESAGREPVEVARDVAAALAAGGESARGLEVRLGNRSYPILVGRGLRSRVPQVVGAGARQAAVVTDVAVAAAGRQVVTALRAAGVRSTLVTLTGGEQVKTWAAAGRLVRRFAALGLERSDVVVAVGGGTVGDLAGFAAASYLRGVGVVHVPTTLLAMVDSAVGGKTGVNLPEGKNLAGAFWQPRAVLCDPDLLGTLPERALRSAFAEIVKCSMVADADLAGALDRATPALLAADVDALTEVVARCAAIKAEVVSGDEREAGRRAILNYGHTVGHALEAVTGYGQALWHGEAVAAGMRVAGVLSERRNGCPAADRGWQDEALARFGLGAAPPVDPELVLARTRGDKKSVGGEPRWVLCSRLGEATGGHRIPADEVLSVLREVLPR